MEKLEQLKEIVNKYSKELYFFVKENNGIDSSQASTFVESVIYDVLDIIKNK